MTYNFLTRKLKKLRADFNEESALFKQAKIGSVAQIHLNRCTEILKLIEETQKSLKALDAAVATNTQGVGCYKPKNK